MVGTWGVILKIEAFSTLKTAFCEYWTSIKIKISTTCVSKEYGMKTKMVHEQWLQLKMKFLVGYNLTIVTKWGGLTFGRKGGADKNLVGGVYWGREGFFQLEEKWVNFLLVGGTLPILPEGKTLFVWNFTNTVMIMAWKSVYDQK